MNMGIEQFVWHKLGRPEVKTVGEVISTLGEVPDWIEVVDDVDTVPPEGETTKDRPKLCIRGACDMMMMTHYLRAKFDVIEEFQFPYENWGIHPVARRIALAGAADLLAVQALLKKMPGIPPNYLESAVVTGAADVYLFSPASEFFPATYRSRSTGLIFPLTYTGLPQPDFAKVSYSELVGYAKGKPLVTKEQWAFLRNEFEFLGWMQTSLMSVDIANMFERLRGKKCLVFLLNTNVGSNKVMLTRFAKINSIVKPLAEAYGCEIVDLRDFVCSTEDLVHPDHPGTHFKREVYMRLAEHIMALVNPRTVPLAAVA